MKHFINYNYSLTKDRGRDKDKSCKVLGATCQVFPAVSCMQSAKSKNRDSGKKSLFNFKHIIYLVHYLDSYFGFS